MVSFTPNPLAEDSLLSHLKDYLHTLQCNCDALLILPPFAGIDRPSLGLHTLQACAKAKGFRVRILYANIFFSILIGEAQYEEICYAATSDLLGERIFSPSAFGAHHNPDTEQASYSNSFRTTSRSIGKVNATLLVNLQDAASAFSQSLGRLIGTSKFPIVGCNTTFEQTSAAISILSNIKRHNINIVTLMGGSNCESRMATGISKLTHAVDHIFSGESEETFPTFLDSTKKTEKTFGRIIEGAPCRNLDEIPDLDYTDYYSQLDLLSADGFLKRSGSVWLPYETSRGCWWGQKHHCTFCGINGEGMSFRQKSSETVLSQLPKLLQQHTTNKVLMTDNIMPLNYFNSLIPALGKLGLGAHIFYEQKSNLSLERVIALKQAGVAIIQPGIEALSSDLLRLMKKGVTASQNISLLRYARAAQLSVNWNLLYAFPGDLESFYESTLSLMPLLHHLHPPSGACHLSIDRFSPYFKFPEAYGISNMRPMGAYEEIFPDNVDLSSIAYHFVGDYGCATRRVPSIITRLEEGIAAWRSKWENRTKPVPTLAVEEIDGFSFLLTDTRESESCSTPFRIIGEAQAAIALCQTSIDSTPSDLRLWATQHALVSVELDGHLTPLATARPELLARFEGKYRKNRSGSCELIQISNLRADTVT